MSGLSRGAMGIAFVGVALAVSLASGCGTRVGAVATPSTDPSTAPVSPVSPTPVVPTPVPVVPTPVPVQNAAAVVSSKSETGGSWYCLDLCHEKVDAQISVTNPNAFEVLAEVTVSYTSSGQATGETTQQTVDLPADGSKTFEAQATQTSDDATPQVTKTVQVGNSNASATGYGSTGYGSSCGSPGYGSTGYGTTPSYGSTTGYGSTASSYGSAYGSGY